MGEVGERHRSVRHVSKQSRAWHGIQHARRRVCVCVCVCVCVYVCKQHVRRMEDGCRMARCVNVMRRHCGSEGARAYGRRPTRALIGRVAPASVSQRTQAA